MLGLGGLLSGGVLVHKRHFHGVSHSLLFFGGQRAIRENTVELGL
jgi:hypothetical protein